jgi:hypothetical protein
MGSKQARKLNALMWRERLRTAIPMVAGFVIIVAILALLKFGESPASDSPIAAEVKSWSRHQDETGVSSYILFVTLADGEQVIATASRHGRAPKIGEKVELHAVRTLLGGVKYRWRNGPLP